MAPKTNVDKYPSYIMPAHPKCNSRLLVVIHRLTSLSSPPKLRLHATTAYLLIQQCFSLQLSPATSLTIVVASSYLMLQPPSDTSYLWGICPLLQMVTSTSSLASAMIHQQIWIVYSDATIQFLLQICTPSPTGTIHAVHPLNKNPPISPSPFPCSSSSDKKAFGENADFLSWIISSRSSSILQG